MVAPSTGRPACSSRAFMHSRCATLGQVSQHSISSQPFLLLLKHTKHTSSHQRSSSGFARGTPSAHITSSALPFRSTYERRKADE
eukprot:7420279-Pyramimonas_sp.AAC.1